MLVFLYLAILLGVIAYFEYKNSKISENINKNMSLILTRIDHMYSLINCIYDLNGDIYENINDFKRRSNKMDLNTIFENAIKQGMTNPGEWMYMYSDDENDFFKNCNSRKYINFKKEENNE